MNISGTVKLEFNKNGRVGAIMFGWCLQIIIIVSLSKTRQHFQQKVVSSHILE
jgi:hypothetical protein